MASLLSVCVYVGKGGVFSGWRGLFFNIGSLEKCTAVNLIVSGLQEPLIDFRLCLPDVFKIP